MIKKHLPLFLAALAALLLAGGYFLMKSQKDPAKTGVLYKLSRGETITEIRLKNAYGTFDFTQKDGTWYVSDGSGEYRTNADKMLLLTDSLSDFSVLRVLDADSGEYGLSEPQAAVSFTTSRGKEHTILVGNVCADAAQNYARAENLAAPLVTDSASVAQLTGSLAAYRTNEVFAVDVSRIRGIEYSAGGQEIVSCRSDDGSAWRLEYPFSSGARRLEINEFLSALATWSISGYPDSATAAQAMAGAGETLTLTDADGVTQTISLGADTGTLRYADLGADGDVVTLFSADIDLSALTPETLIYEAPLYVSVNDASAIRITAEGKTYEITFDSEAQTAVCNGSYIDYQTFIGIYYKYVLLLADGYDAADQEGSEVAGMETTLKTGESLKLTLCARDGDTYFMQYGDSRGFYMDASRLADLLGRLEALG